eukprot:gene508-978_t
MKCILFLGLAGVTSAFGPGATRMIKSPSQYVERSSKGQMDMRWGLKGAQANKPMGNTEDGVALRDTVPFEIRGISLPLVVFSAGALLTLWSLVGFFVTEGGEDSATSSLGFVYGIPVFLIGLSLWYAEIPPVQVISDAAGDRAWESKATETLKKVKADVTRHRYGDDAHLDSTLESLGLKLPQKKFPKMLSIKQEATNDGELRFVMTFQSAETPYKVWSDPQRVKRYETFFGPGVTAVVSKVDVDQRILSLTLTTTSSSNSAASESSSTLTSSSSQDETVTATLSVTKASDADEF